jgi:predicted dehydrogenase
MSVNVALLGSGLFATNSYLPALTHPSNSHLTIHTLWSRSEGSVSKLASKLGEIQSASSSSSTPTVRHGDDGLEAVFNDAAVDAVMFVLPITTQPELIRRAWRAGKHVLSEKPVAKDVTSAQELIKEYEEVYKPKGLIWKVAESEYQVVLGRRRVITCSLGGNSHMENLSAFCSIPVQATRPNR